MAASIHAPSQPSQPSRKGKKAWRKNVDISEVQTGLEAAREEVIEGGIIAERPSCALFTTDTAGSAAIQKATVKKHKPLKVDEILAQRSAVPALDSRKRSTSSRITDGVLAPQAKKKKISHKEQQRLKELAYGGDAVHKDVIKPHETASRDLWADPEPAASEVKEDVWVEKKKPAREPATLTRAPSAQTASGKAPKAVPRPDPGRSYNPDFEAWRVLLLSEGEKEVEAERKRLQEAQEEEERLARVAAAAAHPSDAEEAGDSMWESEWEGIRSEGEEKEWLSKKRPERKTQAERNKIKRRKEEERKRVLEEKMKARDAQARRVREIAKQVEEKETRKVEADAFAGFDADSESDGEGQLRKRKQFGKAAIPDAPLELVLPDELQESLRLMKPEGNLLQDRFRNMLVSGKLEARKEIWQPTKAKRKATEKWTYKDWKLK